MKTQHVSIRLNEATIRRAQALIPAFSMPGRAATASDVYRALIAIGLEEMEKPEPPDAKRRRGHPLIRGGGESSR